MAPFPHYLTIAFSIIAAVGTLIGIFAYFKPKSGMKMNDQTKRAETIIGHDVQNRGPGVGQEIINSGGGTGGEVNVTVPAGTSAIGTRVNQNGPGVGMRVIQKGRGVGFKSKLVIGSKQ